MQCVGVLFCLVPLAYVCGSTLSWSRTYSYEAILVVPDTDIIIPYKVWSDDLSGNKRIDFYNGLVKLYQRRLYGANDYAYFKIYPKSWMGSNMKVCIKLNPNSSVLKSYMTNVYLPNYDFEYKGMENLNGVVTQKWVYTESSAKSRYKVMYSHTIWVTYKVVDKEAVTAPLRYEYKSTVGNFTMDNFTHDYEIFSVTDIDSAIFDLPDELPCADQEAVDKHDAYDPLLIYIDPLHDHKIRPFDRLRSRKRNRYSLVKKDLDRDTSTVLKIFERGSADSSAENKDSFALSDEVGIFRHNDVGFDYFDWRDYDAVSPVRGQTSMCNSCYAFAAASAIESAIFISSGLQEKRLISVQAIIDCSWSFGNNGCNNGNIKSTLNWIKENGIPHENQYGHYLAMEGVCQASNMANLVHISEYKKIDEDVKAIKWALRHYGPLLVSLDGSPESFTFYSKGVYDNKACSKHSKNSNETLLLVGYGKEKEKDYWILKSSYGKTWGEEGYIKIATKNNICGLMSNVYSIKLK